jgi:fluoroquinolone transport system permease protein
MCVPAGLRLRGQGPRPVHGLVRLLRLELTLQARSFVYPATVVSTALICAFVFLLPVRPLPPRVAAFFVFMDPATLGLSFVGAIVLKEKAEGTLVALGITPLRPSSWVAVKTISLTLLAFGSGLVVAYFATRAAFNLPRQLLALGLCSAVAVLIGLGCVARAVSMNHLVMTLLWVSAVLYLPLLSHFGVAPRLVVPVLAIIPSAAMLVVLTAAANASAVTPGAQLIASLYLVGWICLGWWWALREYERVMARDAA